MNLYAVDLMTVGADSEPQFFSRVYAIADDPKEVMDFHGDSPHQILSVELIAGDSYPAPVGLRDVRPAHIALAEIEADEAAQADIDALLRGMDEWDC